MFNKFALCFFDVLGFESRFSQIGLDGMLSKYLQLTSIVDARNEHMLRLFQTMEFSESAYWTSEGDAFIFSRLFGTYASDSILLWSNASFPEARYPTALNLTHEERSRYASDPKDGWKYHFIPCDNLLDVCNEVLCHSIEVGLPLRGALALGEAVLHIDKGVFLGQPLIDAARMESAQKLIGASFTSSFMEQIVPPRYLVPFSCHLKSVRDGLFEGHVLDWPRHWRTTRSTDLRQVVQALNTQPAANAYYENTLLLIDASEARAGSSLDTEETSIRNNYPQFSYEEVQLHARAVRRVPVDPLSVQPSKLCSLAA